MQSMAVRKPLTLDALLVAIDGSPVSERTVGFAIALASRHSTRLVFCHAVDHALAIAESCAADGGAGVDVRLIEQSLDDAARDMVTAAAGRAKAAGVVASGELLDGRAAAAIVAFAAAHDIDAIVIGTRGRDGLARVFGGSVADDVLRRAELPVFVVPPAMGGMDAPFGTILAAIDDSDPSDAAGALALDLAQAEGAKVVLCAVAPTVDLFEKAAVYAYDPGPIREELEAAAAAHLGGHAERARRRGIPCESHVVDGDPADEILAGAQSHHAGLIVVGTHGRRGLRRFFVGSVAESVVRRSHVPVAVLRNTGVTTQRVAASQNGVAAAGAANG